MSTKSRRTGQSSSRSGAAREPPQQQQLLPDDIEKENAAVLNKLPREVWEKVVGSLRGSEFFPFAMTCRYFRDLRQDAETLELERVTNPRDTPSMYTWRTKTTLTTRLETYSYIDTHDFFDEVYMTTIHGVFSSGVLSASAEYVKWLLGEVRKASCEFWGKWQLKGTGEKALHRSYKKWDVAEAEQNIMELAALRNDLDLIKWLRSQDPPCEWSKKACIAAAWANRWDLLRQLLSMGCPIDKGGMFGVVACRPQGWSGKRMSFETIYLPDTWDGKFEILKWLQRDHGCVFHDASNQEMYFQIAEVVKASINHNDLECLQWVRAQGVTWGEIVYGPNENGTFDGTAGLDILRLGQIFVNVDVCLFAALMGHLEILEYAVGDGCPWVPEMCLEAAESNWQDHVVDWITDNPPQPASSDSHESDSLSE